VHSIPPMLRSMQGGNLRVCTKRWGRSTPTPQVAPPLGESRSRDAAAPQVSPPASQRTGNGRSERGSAAAGARSPARIPRAASFAASAPPCHGPLTPACGALPLPAGSPRWVRAGAPARLCTLCSPQTSQRQIAPWAWRPPCSRKGPRSASEGKSLARSPSLPGTEALAARRPGWAHGLAPRSVPRSLTCGQ